MISRSSAPIPIAPIANESIELRTDDATDAIEPLLLPPELLLPLPRRLLPARLVRLARSEPARLLRRIAIDSERAREAGAGAGAGARAGAGQKNGQTQTQTQTQT